MKKIVTLLLALIVSAAVLAQEKDVGRVREPTKKEIFKAINESRDLKQVAQYQVKTGLNISCQIRATWMNLTGKLKHVKHQMVKYDAEVITNDTYRPVDAWLKSQRHRSLLLSNHFNRVGIGKSGNVIIARFRRC